MKISKEAKERAKNYMRLKDVGDVITKEEVIKAIIDSATDKIVTKNASDNYKDQTFYYITITEEYLSGVLDLLLQAERERCAKIAEETLLPKPKHKGLEDRFEFNNRVVNKIAKAIRED